VSAIPLSQHWAFPSDQRFRRSFEQT
jgi:hypothetical protein